MGRRETAIGLQQQPLPAVILAASAGLLCYNFNVCLPAVCCDVLFLQTFGPNASSHHFVFRSPTQTCNYFHTTPVPLSLSVTCNIQHKLESCTFPEDNCKLAPPFYHATAQTVCSGTLTFYLRH